MTFNQQRKTTVVYEGMVPMSPSADPSALTTAQLREAINTVRELFDVRLGAMDRAIELLAETQTRIPADSEKGIMHLKNLIGEKLDSVDTQLSSLQKGIALQFSERDVRTDQAAIATKIAVDAALQAQKEAANATNVSNTAAIAKSELNTTKLIDGIVALLNSTVKATDDKIADLKSRLDRGEGGTMGEQHSIRERRADVSSSTGVVSMMVSIAAVGATLLIGGFSLYHTPNPATDQPYAATTNQITGLSNRLDALSQRLNSPPNH